MRSSRFRSLPAPEARSPGLRLTPLVDTVFNLLLFFAVTTTILSTRGAIRVDLPEASTAEPVRMELLLALDAKGNLFYQQKALPLPELDRLLAEKTAEAEVTVILYADRRVSYAHVIRVLDIVRRHPVAQVALAVEKKSDAR